ncbi:RdgB/HAM1 family non-canonical purine NTP pyrophosphatase [Flavihumibacter fluvii]|uniref:RdgB/HAM1 family non-canonical purine NTP pyrophosphatase n=1 Tax=Flavihumibacter fluvii TaxID=2838157 RepID=UPI001BDE06C6|nr:RdgB/HAM1 family non-canonical purine NTP pyrophosphatase [Flavihumibacter fluvii]ULQ54549.1 RdgB/HAM1 family non-canonical purine NTP pyrophosphatase [Flavihumibacter fluvii]
MQLIFASNNTNKVKEIQQILPPGIELVSLKDAGILIDIPEPHDSLEANAREKSTTIFQLTGKDCFSEDTGLEVMALGGAPGVRSARYAGEKADPAANTAKLLDVLLNNNDRRARFRTVISLILAGTEYQFEGICTGQISHFPKGNNGFGYDPVFIPDGETRSFGEMSMDEKKIYSHRRKATDQLVSFLAKQII